MEELIKNNIGLIKKVLGDVKVSENLLKNMVEIYKLKEDFKSIHFFLEERELWWEAEIYLKNKINSFDEFRDYLKRNKMLVEDNNLGGYGSEIYKPDYIFPIDYGKGKKSELRCNFYNPDKLMSKQKQ